MAIESFTHRQVEDFFRTGRVPKRAGWVHIAKIVARKLDMLDYAAILDDLGSPPGNRLEALKGDLSGNYSIRVNAQWRVIFRWAERGPEQVDIVDYH